MKCPSCGYEEPFCWHYPTFHGLEMPYARIEEIAEIDPTLADYIKKGEPIRPGVLEYCDYNYAYKFNIKSGFVRRRELSFWKVAKWNHIPMEKRKRHIPGKQVTLTVHAQTSTGKT